MPETPEIPQRLEPSLQTPRFTAFGRAAEAKGVEVLVFTQQTGERVAIGYRYGGTYFRASSLGPELTLRGLDSYLSIAIDPGRDFEYLEKVKVVLPETEYSPKDREKLIRQVADSIAHAADGAAGDTREFLEKLKENGVSVRLYLSPEGAPRQVAYSFEGDFFPDKALGREYSLRGLADYFDLTFDPVRDADRVTSLAVRLGTNAAIDRESVAALVEERILEAAVDQPSLADFHQRLQAAGIKLQDLLRRKTPRPFLRAPGDQRLGELPGTGLHPQRPGDDLRSRDGPGSRPVAPRLSHHADPAAQESDRPTR